MIYCINFRRVAGLATAVLLAAVAHGAAAQPKVVASIPPLHALAAGVMAGVGEPAVIVRGSASPHSYALRPSDARLIGEADLVFWIGPAYETFLAKPLEARSKGRAVALLDSPGVRTLRARAGGAWESDDDGPGHDHPDVDPHIFLSPANAQAIVRIMADALGKADPPRRAQYTANAAALAARITALDAELLARLLEVKHVPYVVLHDGYQYFEAHYGLNGVGAITVSPERPPGARRLGMIRRKLATLRAACVFGEPQFNAALVRTVADGTGARTGTLDYMGSAIAPGPDAYFALLRDLARSFAGCLKG